MMNRLVSLLVLLSSLANAAMTDPATGIFFAPKLADERSIAGVGVRKKGPIKVGSLFGILSIHACIRMQADHSSI